MLYTLTFNRILRDAVISVLQMFSLFQTQNPTSHKINISHNVRGVKRFCIYIQKLKCLDCVVTEHIPRHCHLQGAVCLAPPLSVPPQQGAQLQPLCIHQPSAQTQLLRLWRFVQLAQGTVCASSLPAPPSGQAAALPPHHRPWNHWLHPTQRFRGVAWGTSACRLHLLGTLTCCSYNCHLPL